MIRWLGTSVLAVTLCVGGASVSHAQFGFGPGIGFNPGWGMYNSGLSLQVGPSLAYPRTSWRSPYTTYGSYGVYRPYTYTPYVPIYPSAYRAGYSYVGPPVYRSYRWSSSSGYPCR